MESEVKLVCYLAHSILIVFPLGRLATTVMFNVLYLLYDILTRSVVSYWITVAGLIGPASDGDIH